MAEFTKLYEQALARLKTGGMTLEADLADIEAGKRSAVAGGQQALIGAGLGGTTVTGAVPLAAEKTAGRARLRARGGAESKYMTALMSFANLAEASRQRELDRQMGYKTSLMGAQTSLQMAGMPAGGTSQAPVRTYGGTHGASSFAESGLLYPTAGAAGRLGAGQAQQFPSLYSQGAGDMPGVGGVSGGTGTGTGAGAWESPDISFGEPMWGASEQWRSEQPGWVTGTGTVEGQTEQAVTAGLPPSAQGGAVWQRGDYSTWLRVKGVANSAEALRAFTAAKGTPK